MGNEEWIPNFKSRAPWRPIAGLSACPHVLLITLQNKHCDSTIAPIFYRFITPHLAIELAMGKAFKSHIVSVT